MSVSTDQLVVKDSDASINDKKRDSGEAAAISAAKQAAKAVDESKSEVKEATAVETGVSQELDAKTLADIQAKIDHDEKQENSFDDLVQHGVD